MFESLIRDLVNQHSLGQQARPFAQMVLAHMTDPAHNGLTGFLQNLRNSGLGKLVDGWTGTTNDLTPMTASQVDASFGRSGGLVSLLASKLGLGRDGVMSALGFAVPALLSRLLQGGKVPATLPAEAVSFIGDRRALWAAGPAVAAAVAPVAKSGPGAWPWIVGALIAAGALGFCALNKSAVKTADVPAPVAVQAPAVATPAASAVAVDEEPAGSGVLFGLTDSKPMLKVYFDSGKAEVSSQFADKSKDLIEFLKTNADAKAVISGFNDPTGDPVKNAELSKNRAIAVQAALQAAGVPADRTVLEKPAEATGTATTNAASRRVEVVIRK